MGRFLSQFRYNSDNCWLCGSKTNLTREHKVKASDIKRQFPNMAMAVVRDGSRPKFAQGPDSRALKFDARICNFCNSSRTQPADQAYELFVESFMKQPSSSEAFHLTISRTEFAAATPNFLNLFRYFGKILGNQIADSGGPIPKHLCRFVIGLTDRNCIWLSGRSDPRFSGSIENDSNSNFVTFAAHGGLAVVVSGTGWLPKKFHSTLTVGRHQMIFHYELTRLERLELGFFHNRFVRRCTESAKSELQFPTSEEELYVLGLQRDDSITGR